jgi:hypothetical protein
MTAGYIGNRHPSRHCFLHHRHFLLCGISAPALDPGKHFNSISIRSPDQEQQLTELKKYFVVEAAKGAKEKFGPYDGATILSHIYWR